MVEPDAVPVPAHPAHHAHARRQKLFATVYDEIFINFGSNIGFNLFDQNRIGTTLGYQFTKQFNFQLGYMNQAIQKANGRDVENNHALTAFLTFNVDFREEKP